jgi:hypothetical protein
LSCSINNAQGYNLTLVEWQGGAFDQRFKAPTVKSRKEHVLEGLELLMVSPKKYLYQSWYD